MRIVTLALLGIFYAPLALSAPTDKDKDSTYEIEAVVFENRLPELVGDELLARGPAKTQNRGLENAIVPEKRIEGDSFLQPTITSLLEKDGHYRVLAYLRWVQTVDAKSIAKPIRVTSINPGELEGTIRFFMSRHLHLDVNLVLRETVAAAGSEPATNMYQINEQRKIKTQETHYFDHPRLGVLVRVMPLEKDKNKK